MWKGKLDILINNAAQTLADSVEAEERAVGKETLLGEQAIEFGHSYKARVRGVAEGPSVGGLLGLSGLYNSGPSSVKSSGLVPAE